MANELKLLALDEEDLLVVSAHVQDAVLKGDQIVYDPATRSVVLEINRLAWEHPDANRLFFKKFQRRNAILHFGRVSDVQQIGINREGGDAVLSILSIDFEPDQTAPSGAIVVTFSGMAMLRMVVECIECRLADQGAAWEARGKPRHGV